MGLEENLTDGENPNQRSNIIPIVLMGSVVVTASIVNALWLSDNMDYVSDTFYNLGRDLVYFFMSDPFYPTH